MKKLILGLMIIANLFLTGCFEYQDINRVIFVTTTIIDIDVDHNYIIYAEAFHSFRSNETNQEKGERIFFQGKGITLYDAARDFNRRAAFKVDYTQMKAIIVTERVAEDGLNYIMDIVERNQEIILRTHILVTDEEPEDILNFEIKQNEYIGLYLNELMENPFLVKLHRLDRINQYLNERLEEGQTHMLSMLSIKDNPIDARMSVDLGAILKEDRMVGKLTEHEMKAYWFLTNRVDRGLILFMSDFDDLDKTYIAVDTIHNKTKTDIEYDGNKIILAKSINIKTILSEVQSPVKLNLETREKIERTTEVMLKRNCEELFQRMKEENLDIFDIGPQLKRKYPNLEIEDPIKITEIKIEVNNQLKGSSNTFGFR